MEHIDKSGLGLKVEWLRKRRKIRVEQIVASRFRL